jgi:hypothetical protein
MRKWAFLFTFWLLPAVAAPKENLGTLSVSDVLLRPNFSIVSPGNTGFNIGESSIAVQWTLNDNFSGHVRLGSRELVNEPARYVSNADLGTDIMLVEAYGEYSHPYGRFRLGRQPLDFGIEGAKSESDLIFPRSFLFQKRVMGLRDIGFGYAIDYNNFFTNFVIHNGEGDADQDGRLWYTGKWGYKFDRAQIGMSGQTGRTTPASTGLSLDTLASVDPTQKAQWRIGGLFASWTPKRMVLELEGYLGARVQDIGSGKFATGHFDIGYEFTDQFSTFVRYNIYDPNLNIQSDTVQQAALALVFTNRSRNSRIILTAAHDFIEGHGDADEYRFIWSLSPTQLPSSF